MFQPAVQRINVTELGEVRRWAHRYGCTSLELKAAVLAVGNVASDVQRRLTEGRPAPNARAALEAAFSHESPEPEEVPPRPAP